MAMSQSSWRKSTYSEQSGACVEVADGLTGVIPVRDSKDPEGPSLTFTAAGFDAFVAGVKSGTFNAA